RLVEEFRCGQFVEQAQPLRGERTGGFQLRAGDGVRAVLGQRRQRDVVALERLQQAACDHLELEGAVFLTRAALDRAAVAARFQQAAADEEVQRGFQLRRETVAVPRQEQLALDER